MTRRCVSLIVMLALLAEIGCAKRVPVDVYPIRRPSERVKPREKVTAVLREEMTINGQAGVDSLSLQPVEWRTREVTGRLVRWDDRLIAIRVPDWQPGEDAIFEVPLDRLDAVDRWPGAQPGPVLVTAGVILAIVAVSFLIQLALSKPRASRAFGKISDE
ncbi:MAG: hypothetical protein HY710_02840 [Candidatus Latescibacteria bacterium]|nr:hypothetical protein [Candidatus Latescibacterota bacterium]